jgi:hypothetical protein
MISSSKNENEVNKEHYFSEKVTKNLSVINDDLPLYRDIQGEIDEQTVQKVI